MPAADRGASSKAAKEISTFANLREVGPTLIKVLDLTNYTRLQEAYKGFLGLHDQRRLQAWYNPDKSWPLQELLALENQELIAWAQSAQAHQSHTTRTDTVIMPVRETTGSAVIMVRRNPAAKSASHAPAPSILGATTTVQTAHRQQKITCHMKNPWLSA